MKDQDPTIKKPFLNQQVRVKSEAIDNDVSFMGLPLVLSASLLNQTSKRRGTSIISGPSCWFSLQPIAQFSGFPGRLGDVVLGPKLVVLQKNLRRRFHPCVLLFRTLRILEDPWVHNRLWCDPQPNAKKEVAERTNSWNPRTVPLTQDKGQPFLQK